MKTDFGKIIDNICAARGVTLEGMARMLDVSLRALLRMQAGKMPIPLGLPSRIARFYNLRDDEMLIFTQAADNANRAFERAAPPGTEDSDAGVYAGFSTDAIFEELRRLMDAGCEKRCQYKSPCVALDFDNCCEWMRVRTIIDELEKRAGK